jgi:hypothetical protein
MSIIGNVHPTHVTLFIAAVAGNLVAAVRFEENSAAFIAFPDERLCHGFFDDVSRCELVFDLIPYHQPRFAVDYFRMSTAHDF